MDLLCAAQEIKGVRNVSIEHRYPQFSTDVADVTEAANQALAQLRAAVLGDAPSGSAASRPAADTVLVSIEENPGPVPPSSFFGSDPLRPGDIIVRQEELERLRRVVHLLATASGELQLWVVSAGRPVAEVGV